MKVIRIACIVEGYGEVEAVPALIGRIARQLFPHLRPHVRRPYRVGRNKLINSGGLEVYVEKAARRVAPGGAILILLDSDDDCPAELGPQLLDRARKTRPDVVQGVVLAKREYESWFIAAAESLRGQLDLPADLESPRDPESIRGAKEWLNRHLPPGSVYTPSIDQVVLTRKFDFEQAKRVGSFEKCYREIARILATAANERPERSDDGLKPTGDPMDCD